jgi:hypothetical protein
VAKLALTSPTSGGRSAGIVRLRTKDHGVWFFFMKWTEAIHYLVSELSTSHKDSNGTETHTATNEWITGDLSYEITLGP